MGGHGPPSLRDERGFTLLELSLVIGVLMVAFLALSQSLGASIKLSDVNRESALATEALRGRVELLQGIVGFDAVFALYNDDPSDDPGGPGTAPGSAFAVAGLAAVPEDEDGLAGEILFPTVSGAGGLELREDVDDPNLGMPRDLNGDGFLDNLNHANDYRLLPVTVRLRWQAAGVERTSEVHVLLADR